ncbi:hypothetical protein OESDEN_04096 [Oesophagostomum dentatum]|uniref:Uncharacterized protein n=1 Tax=Oesophagostomum dentatum TaxID=61180 RepID=A0A0B1TFA7_OESDE|nr:hypothetical protein OESDEN_04096 [Oesophagostomum dentatum]
MLSRLHQRPVKLMRHRSLECCSKSTYVILQHLLQLFSPFLHWPSPLFGCAANKWVERDSLRALYMVVMVAVQNVEVAVNFWNTLRSR